MTNTNKIKNGSLYFNSQRQRVERVLGTVNTRRVWTKHHKENTRDVQTKDLRLASNEEYTSYLGDNKRMQFTLPQVGVVGAS